MSRFKNYVVRFVVEVNVEAEDEAIAEIGARDHLDTTPAEWWPELEVESILLEEDPR